MNSVCLPGQYSHKYNLNVIESLYGMDVLVWNVHIKLKRVDKIARFTGKYKVISLHYCEYANKTKLKMINK